MRPLEILRNDEERPSRSEKLRRYERKRIRSAYAAATPGGTSHRRTKGRAGGIFRHQLIVGAGKRGALRHGGQAGTRYLLGDVGESEADGRRLEIRDRVPFVASNTAVKDSTTASDRSFAVAEPIPCKSHSPGNMVPANR